VSDTNQGRADFIWSVADPLRGDYKRSEYAKVILPLTVLRRFDRVMEEKGTREAVRERAASYSGDRKDAILLATSRLPFYNTSKQNFRTAGSDDRLALLADRRQALITAAVTGQFDVTTASGRGVDPS
jgi:type I restriction enzyme M protein